MAYKKYTRVLAALMAAAALAGAAAGCGLKEGSGAEKDDITPLTAEELDYFNGDGFFNGDDLNIRNQFLSSLYDDAKRIDLFQLFYCGSGMEETLTQAEREAVIAYNSWDAEPDCPCEKISSGNMNAVLTRYTGLTVAETEKVGLNNFTYLEEYDAYYYYHGDTNDRAAITFSGGERQGDLIRLYYEDAYMGDGEKILTLRETKDGYLFVSNLKKTPSA